MMLATEWKDLEEDSKDLSKTSSREGTKALKSIVETF
jgi:hypothetical protein